MDFAILVRNFSKLMEISTFKFFDLLKVVKF